MRTLGRLLFLIAGAMITTSGCGRDTVATRASVPNLDLRIEETTSVPVRTTARETAPSDTG
jgi:hypothetical protein